MKINVGKGVLEALSAYAIENIYELILLEGDFIQIGYPD